MTKYIVGVLMVRMVLPLSILISIVLRPFGLSVLYLLCFLISPLVAVPKASGEKCWLWYQFLMMMSCLLLMCHIAFHIVLTSFPPYGSILNNFTLLKTILHDLGLVSYESIDTSKAIVLLCPELIMTTMTILIYVVVNKSTPSDAEELEGLKKNEKYQKHPFLISTGKYVALFLILLSGIIKPSIVTGVYFLVFLGTATAWAVGRPLGKLFAGVGRIVMVLMALHMTALFSYQFSMLSEYLPPDSQWARYFGMTLLVIQEVGSESIFKYQVSVDQKWTNVFSPPVILITYYLLALVTRQLFKPKMRKKVTPGAQQERNGSMVRGISFRGLHTGQKDRWLEATRKVYVAIPIISSKKHLERDGTEADTVPLLRRAEMASRMSSRSSPRLAQSSTGSVLVLDRTASIDEVTKLTFKEEVILTIMELFQILIRSSYIPTTITMMAWSIMFHSWLGFVFLMWANIVWLRQDQRSFMLKTSPILVCYACMLLILHYIYGIDLTESELPSNITNVNLRQIGISRVDGEPFVPLLIRSLFTCVFWVTLRQRVQEMRERRQSRGASEPAPTTLSMSTVQNTIEAKGEKFDHGHHLQVLGKYLRFMCARYWIYVVVIMLFVIGITGERMTIFRIMYMALFLWFILMFQISWYWWRRLLYAFWITVIIYSMTNLIMIYIYQFDNFSKLIEKYLLIDQRLQNDLGLEPYLPADLFVKLLTPTLFLIMTIMQVHYFHKDFLAISDPVMRAGRSKDAEWSLRSKREGSRRSQGAASTIKDDNIPPLPEEDDPSKTEDKKSAITEVNSLSSMPTAKRKSTVTDRPSTRMRSYVWRFYETAKLKIRSYTNLVFVYIEIHFIKIIFLSIMLLCVLNVCAMHVPIMLIICPALLFRSHKQRYVILLISTLISLYLMVKMIYQIEYIQHSYFDLNCTETSANNTMNVTTYNNAEWMGFTKATHEKPLVVMLKGYIGLIAAFTFYSLVQYRQQIYRQQGIIPPNPEKVVFTNITRKDADKDMLHCVKYLINYGYYKFGVEITLICLLAVIGSRMDVYAVLYSIWLLILVCLKRNSQARVWPVFTACITLLLPIQYMLSVGFLPTFCVHYPWEGQDQKMKRLRNWLFLPYAMQPPYAMKLIFDYVLLLFASRQIRVFRLEKMFGDEYEGGSNDEDVGRDWESPNFAHPVPDFLGFVGSWLDVIKRLVFLGMLWITLAIMFLTGTNRVNLFSMGYLIGSFIFLWQGTDFYLRPKRVILQWWSWLLYYNVSVVVIKALLQIPGCIFSSALQSKACWLVQLLGIGCVDKFAGGNIAKFIRMEYVKEAACSVPQEDIGLAWDGVCFAFLIVQRRLFHSYYFFRVIDESKATTMLASRGAELIEELRQKQMKIQEEQEVRILEKIKVKMERIKANQKKIHGFMAKEPPQHDAEDEDDDEEGEDDTQPGDTQSHTERAALVRADTDESGRGYHTPESPASPKGFHTPISISSAPTSPSHTSRFVAVPLPPVAPPGPPSPSSALMTHSLDAYLEPRRISFESPPSSDLIPRTQSPEESYPVFSPQPIRRRHTVASPSLLQRTSLISQSSRSEPKSHQNSSGRGYRQPSSHQQAVRSGDYYMFDEFDDTELQVKDDKEDDDDDLDDAHRMGIGKLLVKVFGSGHERRALAMRRRASAPQQATGAEPLLEDAHAHSEPQQRLAASKERRSSSGSKDSQQPVMDSFGDSVDIDEKETWVDKVIRVFQVMLAFINSFMVSLAYYLLKLSRDYRYVSRALSIEKKILKEKKGFGIGIREGAHQIWEPLPDAIATVRNRKLSDISVPEIRILAPSMERGLDASPIHRATPDKLTDQSTDLSDSTSEHESVFSLQTIESRDPSILGQEEDSMFKQHKSAFIHLCYALWYAVVAHTDIVCYLMVFINQIQSATILSIPLPLMVFLWGTLTIPRPTKTFWVTLIAYTEVIVLIKSMFQFEILPWNEKAIPANMPFTAPRIIGIERKTNYALYDLLLLLIIFLHRFMLKSLGLWKETTPEIEIREDADYIPTKEDTQMIMEGKSEQVGKKYLHVHALSGPKLKHEPRVLRRASKIHDPAYHDKFYDGEFDDPGEGTSKVPEDYNEQDPVISVTTTIEDARTHYPKVIYLSIKRYLRPCSQFFKRILAPGARVTADIYAYMFLCDFFNFLVVIFGFAAFGTHQGDGGVQTYLEENKVPIPFLVMLILQFCLIVIDRALYLRKFILGKILFQYGLIIGVHIWMFFVLPFITERTFNALLPPPMWYMVKCIYLLLSAYQIRCGYPRRIIGNFLCKSYHFINMLLFRGFMAVPFLFELRTLMDWIWTDTSMTLLDWLKMEDIFASVYLLKCSRQMEDEFPQPRGSKKANSSKYLLGGSVLAFVIAIIWFPLVFFAFGNTVGQPNPPTDVTVKIRIGPFLPVYQMSAQSHNIDIFTENDYNQLSNIYAKDRTAQTFLANYMYNDIAVITINPNSTMTWEISPPELDRLEKEAASNASLIVKFTYVITHPSNAAQNPPTMEDSREVSLAAYVDNAKNPERDKLRDLLAANATADTWINVKLLFPKFVKVFNKGQAKPASQLTPHSTSAEIPDYSEEQKLYRDVQLRLERNGNIMYWRVRESCHQRESFAAIPYNNCDMLVMYTFNDKLFPETLNFISGSGIIGLYTTFVFLAARVLRGFFSGIYTKIMFDDLPHVDRVLQLCLDIYLVREAIELSLEEDLFAKLVFLYRSPETMIKWSRPKEDTGEQRALPPSR